MHKQVFRRALFLFLPLLTPKLAKGPEAFLESCTTTGYTLTYP